MIGTMQARPVAASASSAARPPRQRARIGVLAVALLTLAMPAWATTYKVGTASASCTSPTHSSISTALAAAGGSGSNHTINICAGTYAENNLDITGTGHAGLTMQSASGALDVKIWPGNCTGNKLITVSKNNVTLKGLDLLGPNGNCVAISGTDAGNFTGQNLKIDAQGDGIKFSGYSPALMLSQVTITSAKGMGIDASGSGDTVTFSRITVTSAKTHGIHVKARWSSPVFTDIVINAGSHGIYLEDSQNSTLQVQTLARNTISAGNDGLHYIGDTGTFKVHDTTLSGGTDSANDNAIQVQSNVWGAWEIKRVSISASHGGAIRVNGGDAPTLEDLDITSEKEGIYLNGSQNARIKVGTLSKNKIQAGATGIFLTGNAGTFSVDKTEVTAGTGTGHHGIRAKTTWGAWQVTNNKVLSAGGHGIYIEAGGSSGVVSNNYSRSNGNNALRLLDAQEWTGTLISGNCFYASTGSDDAYNRDQNSSYTVSGVGNFWGSTSGSTGYSETCVDANANGICDVAYTVPGNPTRSDTAPLKTAPSSCGGSTPTSLHHLELQHASGSGITCSPTSITVLACQDASCSTLYTGGVSGSLSAGSGATVTWPSGSGFTIGSGASSTTVAMQMTTVGSALLGASTSTPTAAAATSCNFGSPSCTFSAVDSGFIFDVPNHVAENSQTVSISAVRKSDSSLACTPAFASVSKNIKFTCGYGNPGSGFVPARVAGKALNSSNSMAAACDATGQTTSLSFNASGVASFSLLYADAGQMTLTASYTGSGSDAGLAMSGSDSFIAAPKDFAFSAITAAPIKAGRNFSATLTARNNAGTAMANFGRESSPAAPSLTHSRVLPTGSGVSDGIFAGSLGSFSAGSATASNLAWTEVGKIDLTATLNNYLGSGFSATGSTGSAGAVGPFTPDHFDVTVTPACGPSFSYAGQPFTVALAARNAINMTTVNYDGGSRLSPAYAKVHTLSDGTALGLGSFGSTAIVPLGNFVLGLATVNTPAYTYTSKLGAPASLVVRTTDSDGVSSLGFSEGSMPLRSGRLRISNAFGPHATALALAVEAQYWSGKSWIKNAQDSCTSIPAAAIARFNPLTPSGATSGAMNNSASAIAIASGGGSLPLSAASPAAAGSLDLAINLGSSTADSACSSVARPASTGANLPWLRSQYGSAGGCGSAWDRDPSARASFGIFSPEIRKNLHVREIF